MSTDNNSGWGRSTTVILPPGHQPGAGDEPRFNKSIGEGPRRTVYSGVAAEQAPQPGLVSQEQAAGADMNTVRYSDQGGKTRAVWVAERHAITEPDGRTPYKGGEVTIRHVVDIEGVGQMRVQQALALGLVDPASLNMPGAVTPKSLAMQQAEQRAKAEPQQAPAATEADLALHRSYTEVATELDAAITKAGGSTDAILTELAKGDPSEAITALAGKVAATVGAEQLADMVGVLELRVLDAVDRCLPQGVELDDVVDALERPENSRRWAQSWVHYLRSGDAGLVQQFAREIARGLK